jgi:hypothetical protein
MGLEIRYVVLEESRGLDGCDVVAEALNDFSHGSLLTPGATVRRAV